MESAHAHRKNEHLSLAEKQYEESHAHDIFSAVRLLPTSLPEMAVEDVDVRPKRLGWDWQWPFYVEAMTGGSQPATKVNAALARQARDHRLAMATGSMSIIFKDPSAKQSFQVVRQENPDGFIMANLGPSATLAQAEAAVSLIDANALEIHLNAAQEVVMAEGDREFYWADHLAKIIAVLPVPVIVKEVGFGMSAATIRQLEALGAHFINPSGRGGTNFAKIEDQRNHHNDFSTLFDWGLTTPESLLEAKNRRRQTRILASGGVTSPLAVLKAGALGADAVGVAGFFLHQLIKNGEIGLDATLTQWQTELPRLFPLVGAKDWTALQQVPTLFSPDLESYWRQRQSQISN